MKKTLIILTLLFTAVITAQEVILKPFDVDKYISVDTENPNVKNPVYKYLLDNYKPISKKENLPSDAQRDCGFKQTFENGITYTKRNCGDAVLANGEVITISNPDRMSVITWVEEFNKMYGDFDQNIWNFDLTEYRPIENLPGAFFNIIRDEDCTTVLVMSGC